MNEYQTTSLWRTAFGPKDDGLDKKRQTIVEAYEAFRERVALLLGQIQAELPSLTLHDITHVDALWRVASEIAGPDYPLNPAEALVLGGAFLLHDAAHCRAAYPGGLDELRVTDEWRDAAAQRGLDPDALAAGSEDFQSVLFDTLRVLHPRQARRLAFAQWGDSPGNTLRLFPHDALREAYGDLIGEIAESHWLHPQQLEVFAHRPLAAPACLSPANWTVSPLKIAVLLRVADAAHIDAQRAPRLLMAINKPNGVSKVHWQFQSRLHQPYFDSTRRELIFSGNPFPADEQAAWWQAFDAANLADRELGAADHLLRDHGLERLRVQEVAGIKTPEKFARHVPTSDWHPVDTTFRISNIQSVVERFGGEKLYGAKPWLALRELIQNARDAIHAARRLGYLRDDEGEIEVAIEETDEGHWLHVTDNGIGMSRYVLTEVLLDFGHSLWSSTEVRGEWSGLAASGFEAVGQFGIGFFSVFMLGKKIRVCTRRCEAKDDENQRGWLLEFNNGIDQRPVLRTPTRAEEKKRAGTRVSILIDKDKQVNLHWKPSGVWSGSIPKLSLVDTCAHLAPAIDVNLSVTDGTGKTYAVLANDWMQLSDIDLLHRVAPFPFSNKKIQGHWSSSRRLTEIRTKDGRLLGRCAIEHEQFKAAAVGVTKGILAGYIRGISGIVISTSQANLARDVAFPDITKRELKIWANEQAETLVNLDTLDASASTQLASYGAEHQHLVIGKLGTNEISHTDFCSYLKKTDKLVVHDEEIYHDDEDPVNVYDFEEYFVPNKNVLEFKADDWSWTAPDWLEQLPKDGIDDSSWSMECALLAAITSAWGPEGCWQKKRGSVAVGKVGKFRIMRICDVYTRGALTT